MIGEKNENQGTNNAQHVTEGEGTEIRQEEEPSNVNAQISELPSGRVTETLRVFISYRVKPDGPIASALKKLIESSIEPQPEVFVSGDGGIRPSNLGFKQQLQDAAQKAHAFVAIITNSSKEREWIFFEAGAAWGRGKTYVPVLVGARPEELSSTIGDYQALNSQSRDDMHRLMTALAECVGSDVSERFGVRYRPFAKLVDEYLNGRLGSTKGEINEELQKAYRLGTQGDLDQSNELFDRLAAQRVFLFEG